MYIGFVEGNLVLAYRENKINVHQRMVFWVGYSFGILVFWAGYNFGIVSLNLQLKRMGLFESLGLSRHLHKDLLLLIKK